MKVNFWVGIWVDINGFRFIIEGLIIFLGFMFWDLGSGFFLIFFGYVIDVEDVLRKERNLLNLLMVL